MSHARKTASSLNELRSQIERGRYEIKPDRVAEAMLRRGVKFDLTRPTTRRD